MAVEWHSPTAFRAALERQYPPVGLGLRPFLSARIADPDRFRAAFPVAPEFDEDWLPGLGPYAVWSALADGVPLYVATNAELGPPGFSVSLPIHLTARGTLDLWSLLHVIAVLPSVLREGEPHFDSLPFWGPGYGVFRRAEASAIFRSPDRADAERILAFVGATEPGAYEVRASAPEDPRWLVAGPRFGRFVSFLNDTSPTRASAEVAARRLEARLGLPFTVFDGRVDPGRL